MREALTSFEAELDKLNGFLDASDAEDTLITLVLARPEGERIALENFLDVIQANSTIKRRQNYVSSIIVLYGALERYVEDAVAEYTEALVDIHQDFQKLPEPLRDRHTKLTIDYLASLKAGRVRETEDILAIVGTLHDCLNGSVPFRLNARAFSLGSSNMKLQRIVEIMRNLEVRLDNGRILSVPAYEDFLTETAEENMKEGEVKGALDHIDELVDLRNDIAHGVANLGRIEKIDIVRERVAKLQVFVRSLNEILTCQLLEHRIRLGQLVQVQGKVRIFSENVVCFPWPTGDLVVKDVLVMKPANQGADVRHGQISSIQIDGVDQTEVHGCSELMVGVKVPFRAKDNGTFYVVPQIIHGSA